MTTGAPDHERDDGPDDGWSAVAAEWARSWGPVAGPVHDVLLDRCAVTTGTRLLDVGCGSGELLAAAAARGADVRGSDPAPGVLAAARARVPAAELRAEPAEAPTWPPGGFDVVTAVNVLHLGEDPAAAVRAMGPLLRPGGALALAGWAEGARGDLRHLDAALAALHGEDPADDGPLQLPGAFEDLLRAAGADVAAAGTVAVAWSSADDADLLRGLLLDAAPPDVELAGAVLRAAAPFRLPGGGYRLAGEFRWAVGLRG